MIAQRPENGYALIESAAPAEKPSLTAMALNLTMIVEPEKR
jgi:hypothetical protein